LASVQHNAQLQLQSFESDRIKLTQEIAQFQAEQQRWAAEIEPQVFSNPFFL
jgi:cobyric acid synthase